MTAAMDRNTMRMRQLMSCCYKAEASFRSAAEATNDDTVKRLFEIYARQRTRFAEELREFVRFEAGTDERGNGTTEDRSDHSRDDWMRECVMTNAQVLDLYREALADRALPTRVHFLISAQLALMEPVHDRVSTLLQEPGEPAPARAQTLSA